MAARRSGTTAIDSTVPQVARVRRGLHPGYGFRRVSGSKTRILGNRALRTLDSVERVLFLGLMTRKWVANVNPVPKAWLHAGREDGDLSLLIHRSPRRTAD